MSRPLFWSEKPPTEPGLYLIRRLNCEETGGPSDLPTLVRVLTDSIFIRPLPLPSGRSSRGAELTLVACDQRRATNTQWAGPIPEPCEIGVAR